MEENKEVVEETTQQPVEETTEQESPVSINEDGDYKIDLTKIPEEPKPEENETTTEVTEDNTDEGGVVENVQPEDTGTTQEQEEVQPEVEAQEEVEQDDLAKLRQFMEETGGSLNDYVKLNTDVNELDDSEVLHDYYKRTKPHLNNEEINFMLEDQFSYDEDEADDKEIRRKKLALKEQVAEAKAYLDGQKSKYYEEIKGNSAQLTSEQAEAIDFYNNYTQEEEQQAKIVQMQADVFLDKTEKVFNNDFKGFEFKVGDKQVTYNVSNIDKVKQQQSDINNFIEKFLNKDSVMEDAAGYHKGLFTAMNPDAVANHFYEQGRADAIKESVSEAKNVNTARQSHSVTKDGITVRVLGDSSDDMKLRIKTRN
jgi:hypothetical protein|tara:strand:+ start:209 stop:1312 length:1104 start_codon:yes stop_codon:yes gene_type:complete